MQTITVIGKRWFQRTYGNTYNSVHILIDGKQVEYLPFGYGYGEYYLQRAASWLEANGYLTLEKYSSGITESLWQACERLGIECNYWAEDVSHKRDL